MFGCKGQLGHELLTGLGTLFVVGIVLIVMNQSITFTLRPQAITNNVNAENLNILDAAWNFIPIFIVFIFVFAVISTARKRPRRVGYEV